MENKICMDDLEAFVLDFLAYRREIREKTSTYLPSAPKHVEYHEAESTPLPAPTYSIPHSIGKGWPHYKRYGSFTEPEPITPQNDIIPTLSPIVNQALSRFGSPTNPKALNHLTCQEIANAMTIPQISESINTAEITPWGKIPLLQAVIELLIRLHS